MLIALAERVQRVDQPFDSWRHDEHVAGGRGRGVPVCVRGAARDEHGAAGWDLDIVVTDAHRERTLDHVPRLVVLVVDMERRDVQRRIAASVRIPPLDHDERSPIDERTSLPASGAANRSASAPVVGGRSITDEP